MAENEDREEEKEDRNRIQYVESGSEYVTFFEDSKDVFQNFKGKKVCMNCRFSRNLGPGDLYNVVEDCCGKKLLVMNYMNCMKHAPNPAFPVVRADDWCGEFDMFDL